MDCQMTKEWGQRRLEEQTPTRVSKIEVRISDATEQVATEVLLYILSSRLGNFPQLHLPHGNIVRM